MTNAKSRLPASSEFGYGDDFNYAVWTAGTQITLANVPWGADYRDIVHYPTQAALDAYVDAHSAVGYTIENVSYAKPGHAIRLPLPFNRVIKWNYIRAKNPAQPLGTGVDTGRSFYYFITDVEYSSPETTIVRVQLDVWSTYGRDVSFGNCYIERGHIGIANSQQFGDHGRQWLTVPEGLDLGSEYEITHQYEHEMVNLNDPELTLDDLYGVIVVSTTSLQNDFGTESNPNLKSAQGTLFQRLANGCEMYYFDNPSTYTFWQLAMASYPWVSQGIISIYVVPRLPSSIIGPLTPSKSMPSFPDGTEMYNLSSISNIPHELIQFSTDFRADFAIDSRYANLKKFLTYPYSLVELTTYSGNPIMLKPECINTDGFWVRKMMHLSPPNPRILFYPRGYNAPAGDLDVEHGEFLDMTTGIFDLPTLSFVNNGYIAYMAANRNAIAYGHSSADWSQTRALNAGINQYNMANKAINAMGDQNTARMSATQALSQNATNTAGWQAAQRTFLAPGVAGGPGVAGAVGGAVMDVLQGSTDYAIAKNHNFQTSAIQNRLARQQTDISQDVAGFNRDVNYAYAQNVAQGDYQNAIAAINAKVQDAKLIQPTTSGQIGGDAFMLTAYKWGIFARLKTLQKAPMRAIGEYWLRYGYAVNTFGQMPSDYQCMANFTYWKLHETYITSATCPETFKQTIRGIFEKGVTVWNDASKIGNIDMANNAPRAGVTL